jgi:hypothetical protein
MALYADDTEIYASSDNCADLVDKVNLDLEHIRKWMLHNKLQIHPSKCNSCLGVNMVERFLCEKHIDILSVQRSVPVQCDKLSLLFHY